MTTPDVPLRIEFTVELPGTPEQVWDALATANGLTAWFMPTDMEERAGGAIVFHMGETESAGHVTAFEAPTRIAYEEPDWATLAGQEGAPTTPLATEMLIEAQSGGTCVVRVVCSAFGAGADWEQEFFEEMGKGWMPFFEHCRLYLTRFPGQTVTPLDVDATVSLTNAEARTAIRQSLGIEADGQPFAERGLKGQVLDTSEERILVELVDPLPGYLAIITFGDNPVMVRVAGYLFSPDAAAYVERERAGWQEWLKGLAN
jgi:uncharacterized protein YndB with AHSA1/START domain